MPRGSLLTPFERGFISSARFELRPVREIATTLGRSETAIKNFIRNPQRVEKRKSSKNALKITERERRLLFKEAKKGYKSANQLRKELNLRISTRRVQELLHHHPELRYRKYLKAPRMNEKNKSDRVLFSKRNLPKGPIFWNKIIFSDEKKFNLDGPDGLACYWHNIREEPRRFSRRQQGGKSIMFWGAISFYGFSELIRIDGKQNSEKYCSTLEKGLVPLAAGIFGESQPWIFMQDGASIHRSQYSMKWLSEHRIETLRWPPYSPDLNIIENVWGVMARRVYLHGRQFKNVEELEEVVREVWESLSREYLITLYRSIPRRLLQVLERKGDTTSY